MRVAEAIFVIALGVVSLASGAYAIFEAGVSADANGTAGFLHPLHLLAMLLGLIGVVGGRWRLVAIGTEQAARN